MAPAGMAEQLSAREFLEPLTDRERDVLRLLPSRLTLSEIAKELYVSVNTLKFHLRRHLPQARREQPGTGSRGRPVDDPGGAHGAVTPLRRGDRIYEGGRCHTETWEPLSPVNGWHDQPAQRSRRVRPARRAIRSSSEGHT